MKSTAKRPSHHGQAALASGPPIPSTFIGSMHTNERDLRRSIAQALGDLAADRGFRVVNAFLTRDVVGRDTVQVAALSRSRIKKILAEDFSSRSHEGIEIIVRDAVLAMGEDLRNNFPINYDCLLYANPEGLLVADRRIEEVYFRNLSRQSALRTNVVMTVAWDLQERATRLRHLLNALRRNLEERTGLQNPEAAAFREATRKAELDFNLATFHNLRDQLLANGRRVVETPIFLESLVSKLAAKEPATTLTMLKIKADHRSGTVEACSLREAVSRIVSLGQEVRTSDLTRALETQEAWTAALASTYGVVDHLLDQPGMRTPPLLEIRAVAEAMDVATECVYEDPYPVFSKPGHPARLATCYFDGNDFVEAPIGKLHLATPASEEMRL